MRLILDVHCDVPDMPDFIRYAVIDITPAYARQLLAQRATHRAAKKKHSELWEMWFWDTHPWWLEGSEGSDNTRGHVIFAPDEHLSAPQVLHLSAYEWVQVPDDFQIDEKFCVARTECDQRVIDADYCRWTAVVKHTDLYFTTTSLEWKLIEKAAKPKIHRRGNG